MYRITMQINLQLFMYLFIYTLKYDYLNEGHKTIELYIYRSFSRFFLQVKNIFSHNCIRKPNVMQTNIIDCMELRSAEIRSHIVIMRISRVYFLGVFHLLQHRNPGRDIMMSTSAPPSYFTVASLHQINHHHMLYSNPRYMLHSNPSLTISTRNPS